MSDPVPTGPCDALPPRFTDARLADRTEIVELIHRQLLLVDTRRWDELTMLFCDPVWVDYSELTAGAPVSLAPADLVDSWRGLGRLAATQHLAAGHAVDIDADRGRCEVNFQATHRSPSATGDQLWTLGGRYEYGLQRTERGWRICAIRLRVSWGDGNQSLVAP